jgi:hypothetical protein
MTMFCPNMELKLTLMKKIMTTKKKVTSDEYYMKMNKNILRSNIKYIKNKMFRQALYLPFNETKPE